MINVSRYTEPIQVLKSGLERYPRAIRVLRSYHQHMQLWKDDLEDDTLSTDKWEALTELERNAVKEGEGRLHISRSGLFTVLNESQVWEQHRAWNYHSTSDRFIAGFWFLLYNPQFTFECIQLEGNSIKTFDGLDEETKKVFVKGFTNRERPYMGSMVYIGDRKRLPTAYCAIIREPNLGEYVVMRLEPFKLEDIPLSWK